MKLKKRQEEIGIKWSTCVLLGVKDTEYNRLRYKSGFALDLISELKNKQEQENTLAFSEEWIEQERESLKRYQEQKDNND